MYDGLIFDLDGTLWDCSEASARAFNRAFQKFGISRDVTVDFVRSISGKPSSECDEILVADTPKHLEAELRTALDKYEIEQIASSAAHSLYPGVQNGIEALATRYALYLVSNCGTRYLQVFRTSTSIGLMFLDSECHGDTGLPKGENIRRLIARNNLSHPCYIGDTEGDATAARHARIPFFHTAYGFGSVTDSQSSFASFAELSDYFLNLAGAE